MAFKKVNIGDKVLFLTEEDNDLKEKQDEDPYRSRDSFRNEPV